MVDSGVLGYLGQTGTNALKGADILRATPEKYSSSVEYAANPNRPGHEGHRPGAAGGRGQPDLLLPARELRHALAAGPTHTKLWDEVSGAVGDFMDDMREHGREDDVIVFMFSEFGRRVAANGSFGTDHGAGGTAWVIGGSVDGGVYGEYPSARRRTCSTATCGTRTTFGRRTRRCSISGSESILSLW